MRSLLGHMTTIFPFREKRYLNNNFVALTFLILDTSFHKREKPPDIITPSFKGEIMCHVQHTKGQRRKQKLGQGERLLKAPPTDETIVFPESKVCGRGSQQVLIALFEGAPRTEDVLNWAGHHINR